jgi:hypothetical protein
MNSHSKPTSFHHTTPRPAAKRPAYFDSYTAKTKVSDNDEINAESTGNVYNTRQIINRNPDDPLNREFTLDVIKQGTKIPPPSGQGLVNRNTLIRQEYKETRNRYLITFFSCISYMMNLI